MKLLKTKAKLVYDPVRKGLKKTHKSRTLIAELPKDDLDLYYQWFLRQEYGTWFDSNLKTQKIFNEQQTAFKTIDLTIPQVYRPMWGKHVTIVRGDEKGYLSSNWGKHEGELIDIYYAPDELDKTWKFWSIPVTGDKLFDLRKELGLKAFHNFHITVAREEDNHD